MTRAELRERMSAHEFGQWMAIYAVQPFGDDRLFDLPQALIRHAVLQAAGAKPKLEELVMGRAGKPTTTLDDLIRGQIQAGRP
jgi:hypothetical protein